MNFHFFVMGIKDGAVHVELGSNLPGDDGGWMQG
jgi:hypothetical protein